MAAPFAPEERVNIRSTAELLDESLNKNVRSHYWRFYGNVALAFVGAGLTAALLALVIELGYLVYLLSGCAS